MMRVLIAVASLITPAAWAAEILCSTNCPSNRQFESFTCTAGSCSGSAAVAADFTASNRYVTLDVAKAWTAKVCAASGQTLSGGGTLQVYGIDPWDSTVPWRNADLDMPLASKAGATTCTGAACRCVGWSDFLVGVNLPRKFKLVPDGVTVSGGATLSVYVYAK